jgi:ribose 5-phosphate isomerase A
VLGTKHALPIEVVDFGLATTVTWLQSLGATPVVRREAGGGLYRTDQGNLIVDADFGPIPEPAALAERLAARAGIVEHGLFVGLTDTLVVAGPDGIAIHQRR